MNPTWKHSLSRLALAATALLAAQSLALTLYWDGNGDGALGGTGTWSTSGLNGSPAGQWSTDSTLTSNPGPYGAWDQAGGQDIAVFRSTGGVQGTVTISGTVNANRVELGQAYTLQGGTLNLTGGAVLHLIDYTAPNNWITLNGSLTGSNGLTTSGNGYLAIGGTNSYSGTTAIGNSGVTDIISSTAIPAGSLLSITAAKLRIRPGVSATAAGLTGTASLTGQGGGNGTLTLSRNDGGTSTFTGVWSEVKLNLVKDGNYTQVFGGTSANTNPGVPALTVKGGTLALAKTAGLDAVPNAAITISGGQLRLDAANQINNAATMTLAGGTFNLNGFSETLGALTLGDASALDFGGSGASTLTFASGALLGGLLTISNWDGAFTTGGGTDQLRFTSAPGDDFLSALRFAGYDPGARTLDFGTYVEVLPPIPEPGALALLMLTTAATLARRAGRRD
jgi:hypothetical protein